MDLHPQNRGPVLKVPSEQQQHQIWEAQHWLRTWPGTYFMLKYKICFLLSFAVAVIMFLQLRLKKSLVASSSNSTQQPHSTASFAAFKYKDCIHHMSSKRIPNLISKLNENPQLNALIPVDIYSPIRSADNRTEHVFGLNSLDTFRGKKIALMGDSTLYYMAKHLHVMLTSLEVDATDDNDNNDDRNPDYEKMTLNEAENYVKQQAEQLGIQLECCSEPLPFHNSDGTWMEWMGMKGPALGQTEELLEKMFDRAEKMKPDVIVANMA